MTCLSLYYFDGLSQSQIGQQLGIHQRVVCQHICYGRKKLEAAGMELKRVEIDFRPTIVSMGIHGLDRLSPDATRGLW
ncbi:MAG: sigma-70 family RNA polymerase sigma factor [Planctomycetes bacterium]|nr:sigma-70 family RNA polymerase sigma factor [Planctomycetota bacterium]